MSMADTTRKVWIHPLDQKGMYTTIHLNHPRASHPPWSVLVPPPLSSWPPWSVLAPPWSVLVPTSVIPPTTLLVLQNVDYVVVSDDGKILKSGLEGRRTLCEKWLRRRGLFRPEPRLWMAVWPLPSSRPPRPCPCSPLRGPENFSAVTLRRTRASAGTVFSARFFLRPFSPPPWSPTACPRSRRRAPQWRPRRLRHLLTTRHQQEHPHVP